MARQLAEERQTLTVVEAARVLGIARNSAYEAARVGLIPTIRIGRRLLVPRAALERLLAGDATPVDRPAAPPWLDLPPIVGPPPGASPPAGPVTRFADWLADVWPGR